jgi:G:T/U-mismatch repair DNA glycosylase
MASKKVSSTRKKINELYEENELANLKQTQTRARSFTIGTTTGGIIEVALRGDFANLWYLLQPVEAVEVINQLAAAAGLEIAMRPRQDFATWRGWDTSLPPSVHWMGAAPWQLTDEQRAELEAVKAKNIKAIQQSEENVE